MPLIISNALNISTDEVKTVALQAYQLASYEEDDADTILTVYLATIPSTYVDALEDLINAPTSSFYTQSGVEGQLSDQIVSTFSIRSYATTEGTTTGSSSDGTNTTKITKDNSKTIIIAVVVSCGLVLLAIAGYLAFRATKRGAIALGTNSPRMERNGSRDNMDPTLRTFQLGGGNRDQFRDSMSSTSTSSTGFDGSSRGVGGRVGRGHATSTSVDMGSDGQRSSWWRFSGSSGGPHTGGSMSPNLNGAEGMREGPRRVNIVRGPNGQFDGSVIGR